MAWRERSSTGRDPGTVSRGASFTALPSWTPDQGLLGMVAESRSIWLEGVGRVLAGLAARSSGG